MIVRRVLKFLSKPPAPVLPEESAEEILDKIKKEVRAQKKRDLAEWDHNIRELEWKTVSRTRQKELQRADLARTIEKGCSTYDNISGFPWNPTAEMLSDAGFDSYTVKDITGEVLMKVWTPG